MGDFNQITCSIEKLSRNLSLNGASFVTFFNYFAFIDIQPKSNWFTLTNDRVGEEAGYKRLDRMMNNEDWINVLGAAHLVLR